MLYWYDKVYQGQVLWDQNFQAFLPDNLEYYPEYLEANRFPGENQSQALHDYLLKKYSDRSIDVVVANSEASLNFLLKYRNDLFPHVPIVFYCASRPLPVKSRPNGTDRYRYYQQLQENSRARFELKSAGEPGICR